jgi:hypothetical protein
VLSKVPKGLDRMGAVEGGGSEGEDAAERKRHSQRNIAREYLIYGPSAKGWGSAIQRYRKPGGTKQSDVERGAKAKQIKAEESPLIMRMASKVPTTELLELQLASGHVPPSEGIIIDQSGTIVSQAVGYGDDWYLPFNLKNISRVNGGEYIRTRVLGGPSSEDVYTALITEARAVTVISNSGIYTLEFDKDFRGARRFGDKPKRMVDRYERLLDAVKEGKVAPGVPSDVEEEIRADIKAKNIKGAYADNLIATRLEEARRNPEPSKQAIREAQTAYLASRVENQGTDLEGWLEEVYVPRRSVELAQAADVSNITEDDFDRELNSLYSQVAPGMGLKPLDTIAGSSESQALRDSMARRDSAKRLNAVLRDSAKMESFRQQARDEFEVDPIAAASKVDPNLMAGWQREEERFRASYARGKRPIALNADGYFKALQALQQQFPYYIKRVEHRQLPDGLLDSEGNPRPKAATARDRTYIKPRFNRPSAAGEGYFDREVTGKKRVAASASQSQNRLVMERLYEGKELPAPEDEFLSTTRQINQSGAAGRYGASAMSQGSGSTGGIAQRLRNQNAAGVNAQRAYQLYESAIANGQIVGHGLAVDGQAGAPLILSSAANDPNWASRSDQFPILSGNWTKVKADYGLTGDRSQLPGAKLRGPFSEQEFIKLAEMTGSSPGGGFLAAAAAELNSADLQASNRMKMFRSDNPIGQQLDAVMAAVNAGGASVATWPDLATDDGKLYLLTNPRKVYNFGEGEQNWGPDELLVAMEGASNQAGINFGNPVSPGWGNTLSTDIARQISDTTRQAERKIAANQDATAELGTLEALHRMRRYYTLWEPQQFSPHGNLVI